jgi:hypothetical protein
LNGTVLPNNHWGLNPVGLITYTRYGYMSANLVTTEGANRSLSINWPPRDGDPDADWALAGKGALSYAGLFSVNETSTKDRGVLFHGPMTAASVPAMINATQVRHFEVHDRDDGTYLLLYILNEKSNVRGDIWWKRLVKG